MSDSQSDVFDKYTDWESIEFSFDINPKAQGGFFPFLNKTSLDLSKYGIFKEIIDSNYSTNCFIQAIKNSDIFTPSEIDLIQSTIKTRVINVFRILFISIPLIYTFKYLRIEIQLPKTPIPIPSIAYTSTISPNISANVNKLIFIAETTCDSNIFPAIIL